ncbi:MAG: RluA family pseudouridine synthase [Defluviitaleaceae bacterium]|nr:RluA family pseudouridine synthase [Defluviitaleaceae bacterium]
MQIIIPPEAAGVRADVFLSGIGEIPTRSAAQKLLADGNVLIGTKPLQKNHRLQAGDILEINLPQPTPAEAFAEDIPLNIIFEDSHLLVINKPQGMVVHPAAGNHSGTLVNALLHHCKDLSGIGGVMRPGIVHRLDKDTSGLLVVAKNDAAHQALSGQLAARSMGRTYNAICRGILKKPKLKIDLPIGRHPNNRKKMAITKPGHGRDAVTYIEAMEFFKNHTLIEAQLETGRTHQIRVHLAHIGHPVLGDEIYGTVAMKGMDVNGQLLHAQRLSFVHPATGEGMEFEAEWPGYFCEAVEFLRQNR